MVKISNKSESPAMQGWHRSRFYGYNNLGKIGGSTDHIRYESGNGFSGIMIFSTILLRAGKTWLIHALISCNFIDFKT